MNIDFKKYNDGLVPAIVQDADTNKVLMLGFMNEDALNTTLKTNKVTFYSRSKNRLWQKGEESGNILSLVDVTPDCDQDTLLVKAKPTGPTCHKGTDTCFNEENKGDFIYELEEVIKQRKESPSKDSYVSGLFEKGMNKIAQKVGEEATELVIEAKDDNKELFINEAADLLFHYLILLTEKNVELGEVISVLKDRHAKTKRNDKV